MDEDNDDDDDDDNVGSEAIGGAVDGDDVWLEAIVPVGLSREEVNSFCC